MEGNSSGDDVVVAKMRKPYTITKQRERWTEEEHNRFLEALKLHGRAWQRIEEHIGTKTAVQIRSHAQKFFTKLEKEALEKGIPPGQTHDIDIPPPRPKRKPTSPYPRKSNAGSVPSGEITNGKPLQAMPLLGTSKAMNILSGTHREKRQTKDVTENDGCSEVLNSFQDSLSASTCISKSSASHRKYLEFFPTKKKTVEMLGVDKSSVPLEVNQKLDKYVPEAEGISGNCSKSQINLSLGEGANTITLQGLTSKDTIKGELTRLKKPPVNSTTAKDGANDMQTEDSYEQIPAATTGQLGGHGNANPSAILITPAALQNITIGSPHHPFPAFSPFTEFHNSQDAHGSFLNISSTFSSLIVSTLLQNPAVHAAASLAASLWPSAAVETPEHPPEISTGEIPEKRINPTPCLEAIAAATVAAAAAWWAAQGLLSWFPHPLSGFAFPPTTVTFPSADISSGQTCDRTLEKPSKEDQQIGNLRKSEAIKPQHHPLKALSLSSSDSEVSGRVEDLEPKGGRSNKLKPLADSGFHDSDAARNKKKQDRSSCGSNTPSGSEVETDTIEKHEKLNNESKEVYFSNCSASETNYRRLRSGGSMNESWKEVSEEGRLAFQALFKREVLPQSFSPPLMQETASEMMKAGTTYLQVDFNKSAPTLNLHHLRDEDKEEMRINDKLGHGKLKTRRTGFKPYKRCSVEAKENRAAAEESGNKKIRLQEEFPPDRDLKSSVICSWSSVACFTDLQNMKSGV